ncbi:glycosyltransferase [Lentisphaerota bacterium ZTH]|nr:glycosyltransferase family 2 protein [Lentisphaerota bacterium]WET07679.1 glycosyltransferase [Lentisphaerota bacterium ZTH]
MNSFLDELNHVISLYLVNSEFWQFFLSFFPVLIFIEFPLYALIILSAFRIYFKRTFGTPILVPFYPDVTCVVKCYSEGNDILRTVSTLVEQRYRGNIEILLIIDDIRHNSKTLKAAEVARQAFINTPRRHIKVIPKQVRGGVVSSINLGLSLAKGEILIMLDGDSSCSNDFVSVVTQNFVDQNVIAVSCNFKVRNCHKSLATRFQTLEYMFTFQMARTGLSGMGILNNVSGGCGAFRKSFIKKIGGWRNGTAEDLDLIIRIKGYFKRYPYLKIVHDNNAVAYTDVPDTMCSLFKQRLRWDGDLYYIILKRYRKILRPKMLGWKKFLGILWYDIGFCMLVPLLIVLYSLYLLMFYKHVFFISVLLISYLYYLFWSLAMFMLYLLITPEKKAKNLVFIPYILLMPLYQFIMRLWTVVAAICETLLKIHKDTSMAPWWVIKKTH